jgi:hypothetical protein
MRIRIALTAALLVAVGIPAALVAAVGDSTAQAKLALAVADARFGTAKYVDDLARAKKDGYVVITRHIPSMGWHFLNPKAPDFNPSRPQILVYIKRGSRWQLGAVEWVFPEKPAKTPVPGATYGSFPAACHYIDGTFAFADAEADCAVTSPETGANFGFWHPLLVTLHMWVWYPNPDGLFAGTNPLLKLFDKKA